MISLLVSGALAVLPPTGASTLNVELTSAERQGVVVVALFDSEAGWKSRRNPVRISRAPAGQVIRFEDLPEGRYGVMAFLDKNGDDKLNTLPIGLPTEPYGFSMNARGMFGPPSWRTASFDVRGVQVRQTIRLR